MLNETVGSQNKGKRERLVNILPSPLFQVVTGGCLHRGLMRYVSKNNAHLEQIIGALVWILSLFFRSINFIIVPIYSICDYVSPLPYILMFTCTYNRAAVASNFSLKIMGLSCWFCRRGAQIHHHSALLAPLLRILRHLKKATASFFFFFLNNPILYRL